MSDFSLNKKKILESCMGGEVDKLMIRPTIWKLLLGVFSFDQSIPEWIKLVNKQRNEYKSKLKGLNSLKKFSGDPLGGTNDVN
jgi:hypothetical protein